MTEGWAELGARFAGKRRLVQLISDLSFADAASGDTVAWQRLFMRHGFDAPIYARHLEGAHGGKAAPIGRYQPRPEDLILFHYTVWSEVAELVREQRLPHVLVYHNVTPPRFNELFHPSLARDTRRGREELASLASLAVLGLGDSELNRAELDEAGFAPTGVVPILLDLGTLGEQRDAALERDLLDGHTNVLVVGRVVPNKRIEEDVAVFAHYARIEAGARLLVVGALDETGLYASRLRWLVEAQGLSGRVQFAGRVSNARLASYYRGARVLLTMSEHEGFCVPLLEAMYFGVPVIARAATAIPETAGGAAILIEQKRFDVIAELMHQVATDDLLRARLIGLGRARAEQFSPARVEAQLAAQLALALAATSG